MESKKFIRFGKSNRRIESQYFFLNRNAIVHGLFKEPIIGPLSWKSTWRHFSAVGGPISIKFRRLVQNDTPKSKPEVVLQSPIWHMGRPVCRLWCSYALLILNFLAIFLHRLIACEFGKFVLIFWNFLKVSILVGTERWSSKLNGKGVWKIGGGLRSLSTVTVAYSYLVF